MSADQSSKYSVSAHLRACELALLDPIVRCDRARVAALLAEDFEEFGSSGRIWSREAILSLLETEDYYSSGHGGLSLRFAR